MKHRLALALTPLLISCTQLVIISPYDSELDRGLGDAKQKLNILVIEAASHMGTAAGSFDAYRGRYADLEVQLSTLRSRASMEETNDVSCAVPEKLKQSFASLFKNMPAAASIPPGTHVTPVAVPNKEVSAARGCMTILIDNVGAQLMAIEAIHAQPDQCGPKISCMPAAAVEGALSGANQSLDMALFVELYKKDDKAK